MAIREYIVKITDEVIPDGFERFENEYAPEGQLVRCKDCKYILAGSHIRQCCRNMSHWQKVDDDWFCAGGERKEGR
jgi:hypothetical protein